MLNLRTGPNFHPFHSVNNHFQHNVHKFQDGRRLPSWIAFSSWSHTTFTPCWTLPLPLGAQIFIGFALRPTVFEIRWKTENPRWPPAAILDSIFGLVTHHIYTMPTLPLPLRAQIFIGFALRPPVSEIKWKTENPRWPPAAILDSILVLVRHHSYTIPTLPLPLGAQIFIGFALRPMVSEIHWKTENPRWPPATILDSILVSVRHHSYTIPTLPLPLGAQIFIGFALRPTVSEIQWKTENPRWPPAAILDSILVLVRHHGYTIPTLPLPLGAQIFIGFALRPTVSRDTVENGKSKMAAGRHLG